MHLVQGRAFLLSRTLVTTGLKAQHISSGRLSPIDWLWAGHTAVDRCSARCNYTAELCGHGKAWQRCGLTRVPSVVRGSIPAAI